MTSSHSKTATSKKNITKSSSTQNNDLATQMPLSEKDEVKNAERKTNKVAKK
ncbi:hypothetical protein ABIB62_003814 [Mucilaginibacter sp. UYP25]|uniref:hypothetical protein n=1 Tax=unclassified Mucilaginibacter TaxID=2617802 RepID=UPI00339264C4